MPEWTKQQTEAICDRGHSLIVCAAAGSGKTAVLTERIARLVAEGTAITDMLVVTFTKAAAAEMRSRIQDALRKAAEGAGGTQRAWLAEQSLSVGRAQISTLHSFCAQLLREHFETLELDPSFRIADEQENDVLREQAMNDALYGCYDAGSEAFLEADLWYGEDKLRQMAEQLWRAAHAQPSPEAFYARARAAVSGDDEALLSGPAAALVLERTRETLRRLAREARELEELCEGALPKSYRTACEGDGKMLSSLSEAAGSFRSLHEALQGWQSGGALMWASPRASGKYDVELKNLVRSRREALKKETEAAVAPFFTAPEDLAEDMRRTALPLIGLIELAETYGQLFSAAKRRRSVLDYDDLEREALRALQAESSGVREALAQRYRYIFVDEYQDSSEVQEAILSAFANLGRQDALFQVGDVKQSIYRFRQASPALFRAKAETYAAQGQSWARRIDLTANFRSRGNVLAGVNAVFERIMRADVTEIEYDVRERLVCGLGEREDDPPLEMHVLPALKPVGEAQRDEEEDSPQQEALAEEREALTAAARLRDLLGTPIYDAKQGKMRETRWRDMAVLLRSARGKAARIAEIFAAKGIPVFCDVGQEYYEIPEIRQVIAVLQAVDNGARDTALLAALRSPAFGFTDSDLAEIRIAAGRKVSFHEAAHMAAEGEGALAERLRAAYEKLAFWRLCARHQGVDRLVGRILSETQLTLRAAAMPDGAGRLANLHLLEAKARRFAETQGGSLHAFLRHVEQMRSRGDSDSARPIGEHEDVVRIMTVHKSKGLEFPVVLLMGMGQAQTGKDKRSILLTDGELGAALRCMDMELHTQRETLLGRAIALRKDDEALAEEIRVLYVAMTRAMNRLILMGRLRGDIPAWWQQEGSREDVRRIRTELDMVCPMLCGCGAEFLLPEQEVQARGSRWKVFVHRESEAAVAGTEESPAEALERMQTAVPGEEIRRLLAFRPEVKESVRKTSVTAVIRDEKFRQEDKEDAPAQVIELLKRPRFLMEKKLSGAEIGTAFHRQACACDLDALRGAQDRAAEAARQAEEMRSQGVVTPQEAEAAPPRMLSALYASPLGGRILNSPRVEREWAFTWRRKTPEGEQLLQGVIDCCFIEDGRWVLVDYKTDAARDVQAVLDRHRPQLALYQEALEELTGIPVAERLLWLVRAQAAYRV